MGANNTREGDDDNEPNVIIWEEHRSDECNLNLFKRVPPYFDSTVAKNHVDLRNIIGGRY